MIATAAVDVGKSGLRLTRWHAEAVESIADDESLSPAAAGDHGEQIATRIVALLRRLGPGPSLGAIVVGSTAELDGGEQEALAAGLQRAFPAAIVASCSDGLLAHARLVGGPGTLLAVGTGVISIALDSAGVLKRFDGWGPLLGDRGSAADVGRAALRLAHAQYDVGVESALVAAAAARFGDFCVQRARELTADPQWPVRFADFGGEVAMLASGGCDSSVRLVAEAAEELANTAHLAARAAGRPEVVLTGKFGSLPAVSCALNVELRKRALRSVTRTWSSCEFDVFEMLRGPYRSGLYVTPSRRRSV